jgi:hypothetical protein
MGIEIIKIRGFRWWIAGLLLLASILNCLDHNPVSVLAPSIQRELDISDQQYAHVMSFSMMAYSLAYLCSGWVGSQCANYANKLVKSERPLTPSLSPSDGERVVGRSGGGVVDNLSGFIRTWYYSYRLVFFAMVALHPLALLLIYLFARKTWAATPAAQS